MSTQRVVRSRWVWTGLLLSLTFPRAARAEDIVLGMSAAFKGPSRGLGIELYRGSIRTNSTADSTGN